MDGIIYCGKCNNSSVRVRNITCHSNWDLLIKYQCTECGIYSINIIEEIKENKFQCEIISQYESMLNKTIDNVLESLKMIQLKFNEITHKCIQNDKGLQSITHKINNNQQYNCYKDRLKAITSSKYYKAINSDFQKINKYISYINTEISLLFNDLYCPFMRKSSKKEVSSDSLYSIQINKPKSFNHSIRIDPKMNVISLLSLSDGHIAIGSQCKLKIYNIQINKRIKSLTGCFKKILELKHYSSEDNHIKILSLEQQSFSIYDIETEEMLQTFIQYDEIESLCELSNGAILFCVSNTIYQSNLKVSFSIHLNGFCYSLLELHNKQIAYCEDNIINIIDRTNPNKVLAQLIGDRSSFQNELKELKDDILLSSEGTIIQIWNINTKQCIFTYYNSTMYTKEIKIYNDIWYFIGDREIDVWDGKDMQNIYRMKGMKSMSDLQIKITTPFDVLNDGRIICVYNNDRNIISVI